MARMRAGLDSDGHEHRQITVHGASVIVEVDVAGLVLCRHAITDNDIDTQAHIVHEQASWVCMFNKCCGCVVYAETMHRQVRRSVTCLCRVSLCSKGTLASCSSATCAGQTLAGCWQLQLIDAMRWHSLLPPSHSLSPQGSCMLAWQTVWVDV